ncbi:MAG: CesT family type III secretion system chaperone [Victivallales bacterium]|nr:CesT family type III secretion system chaperone [Victivallales bacterium]
MLKIDLRKVLAEFGEALGLELAFDDNGVCVLTLDEDTPIAIRAMEEDSSMTLSCAVREELPQFMSLSQVEDLLALALDPMEQGGASPVVGLDSASGLVVLYVVLTPSLLAKTSLVEIFGAFETTRKSVAAMLDEPVEAPPEFEDHFSKMWV